MLQTTIRCSGRGTQGTSWLNIGIAGSFCRIIESILCKWRLPWNLSHHCSLGSPPLWSSFQKLTPYQPCFRKSCQNLLHSRYNEISKSLCLCQAQLGSFFLQVSTICKYKADWWCWNISYHLLENKNHVLGLSALQHSRLGRYFRGNVGEPLNHLEPSIPPVRAQ